MTHLTIRPDFTRQATALMQSGCPEDAAFYWAAIIVEASERATRLWGALERLTEWAEGEEGQGCASCLFSEGHDPDGCIVAGARGRLDEWPFAATAKAL